MYVTDISDIRGDICVSDFSRIPSACYEALSHPHIYMVQLQPPIPKTILSLSFADCQRWNEIWDSFIHCLFYLFSASSLTSQRFTHLLAKQLSARWIDGVVHAADGFPYRRGYKRVAAPTDVRGFPKQKERAKSYKFTLLLICLPNSRKSAYQYKPRTRNSTAGQTLFPFAT